MPKPTQASILLLLLAVIPCYFGARNARQSDQQSLRDRVSALEGENAKLRETLEEFIEAQKPIEEKQNADIAKNRGVIIRNQKIVDARKFAYANGSSGARIFSGTATPTGATIGKAAHPFKRPKDNLLRFNVSFGKNSFSKPPLVTASLTGKTSHWKMGANASSIYKVTKNGCLVVVPYDAEVWNNNNNGRDLKLNWIAVGQ